MVCAFDVTHDPAHGADCAVWSRQVITHPAFKYVIFNSQIYSRSRASEGWRHYGGSSPHSEHMHVSVGVGSDGHSTGPYDDTSPWGIGTPTPEDDMPLNDQDRHDIQAMMDKAIIFSGKKLLDDQGVSGIKQDVAALKAEFDAYVAKHP